MILNWPNPADLLQSEVESLHAIQTGKIVILSDMKTYVANALKRIEILQILVQKHGNQWVGNSIELFMKFSPDMMNDQPILPPPEGPSPITG